VGLFGRLFSRGRTPLPEAVERAFRLAERELETLAGGGEVSDAGLKEAEAGWQTYCEFLFAHHGVDTSAKLGDEDRADFWLSCTRLTALDHPSHSGWPFLSSVRTLVLPELKRRLKRDDSAWTRLGAIMPALYHDEVPYAVECYSKVRTHRFFGPLALNWVREWALAYPDYNPLAAALAFLKALHLPA
jgi:hypothetical protein